MIEDKYKINEFKTHQDFKVRKKEIDFLDNFFNSKFCESFFSFCSDDGWLKNIFEHKIKERFFQNNFGRFFMSGMTWSNSKKERELSKKFYKEIEERFFIT